MAKILITGSEGFIGSHLTETMVREGHEVRAFVLYNSFNSWGWLETLDRDISESIEIFQGDVRDPHNVIRAAKDVESIFHLAALIAIPYSYQSPDSYVDTNVKGTLNVLNAALHGNVEKVFVTSTSEVYGTARYTPIDENHPLQAQSPYSASKIGADRLAESFHKSFGLPVTIVRPFNTYGPRQSARAVIPTIISQILAGMTKIKLGNLEATRDLCFVKDTCRGFVAIAGSGGVVGEEINIGTGTEISIRALAEKIIEMTEPRTEIVVDENRMRPPLSEVERLVAGADKIRRLSGWEPSYSLEEGLSATIEWMRNNLDRYKPDIYNI